MTEPFEDWGRDDGEELVEELERQLEVVLALDGLDEDVTSWEAGFLDSAIKRLRDQKLPLTPPMLAVLKSMCEKYGVDCP